MSLENDAPRDGRSSTSPSAGALATVRSPVLRPMATREILRRRVEPQQGLSLHALMRSVAHWWKPATPAGLVLAVGAAAVVWWLFEPMYLAQAMIRIRETPPKLVFEVQPETKTYVETQKDTICSDKVLRRVVDSGEIKNLPELRYEKDKVNWLRKQLRLESGKSEFLRVKLEGPDPDNAVKIVNRVVQEYFQELEGENVQYAGGLIASLESQIRIREKQVEEQQEAIRKKAISETGKDPFSGTLTGKMAWPHPLAELQNQLTVAEVEREVLEAEMTALKETPNGGAALPADETSEKVAKAIQDNVELQSLEYQVATTRTQLRQIETRAVNPSKDATYRQMTVELARDQKRLAELKSTVERECKAESQKAVIAKREDELAQKKREVERGRRMEEALRKRYTNEMANVVPGAAGKMNLEFEEAELARANDVLKQMKERVGALKTELQAPSRVWPFDEARPPDAPVVEVPYVQMGIAALAGLCLPFGLAIGWERIVRRITSAEQLEEETNLAVIGEIARLPERRMKPHRSTSKHMAQRLRMYEESVDSMRTFLVLAEGLKDVKTLAVTSATSDEGKTSVAAQLALSLARASGKPTLLIDGDMRAPNLQDVFEVSRTPGLAEVLRGECELNAAIVHSWTPRVDVLPAGELKASPHGLVGNGALTAILEQTSVKYRYVVIDTPPILAAAESLVLSKAADASLVCAMQDVSRASQVRKACDRLVGAGCRPVAAVLNGVSPRLYESRYGRYDYAAVK